MNIYSIISALVQGGRNPETAIGGSPPLMQQTRVIIVACAVTRADHPKIFSNFNPQCVEQRPDASFSVSAFIGSPPETRNKEYSFRREEWQRSVLCKRPPVSEILQLRPQRLLQSKYFPFPQPVSSLPLFPSQKPECVYQGGANKAQR